MNLSEITISPRELKMSKCNQCDRPGLIPVVGNIYVVACPACENVQAKKEEVKA